MTIRSILVRGSTGVTMYVQESGLRRQLFWRCTRRDFVIASPDLPADGPNVISSMLNHSQTHSGTVQQLVQLDL